MANTIDSKRLGELMQRVFLELKDLGEPARVGELLRRVAPKLDLTEYEKAVLEKSGYIRWESMIHWFSVDCVKAGLLRKSGGRWTLTGQGASAIDLPPEELVKKARAKYAEWKQGRVGESENGKTDPVESEESEEADTSEILRQVTYDQAIGQSRKEIEDCVNRLGPYDFQKLVAELLRAMGYHVPFVAPPGPDGGIDIIAYKDPLGTSTPRIRAQVKHRPTAKVNVSEVRALEGVLRKEGDMGLIVSSGGFTSEADREIQVSSKHIEAMDLDRLITLWQNHYENIREQGKNLLPLIKVFFLAPSEE